MSDEDYVVIDEAWESAPVGSRLETNLHTGEQRVLPPVPPVLPDQFVRRSGMTRFVAPERATLTADAVCPLCGARVPVEGTCTPEEGPDIKVIWVAFPYGGAVVVATGVGKELSRAEHRCNLDHSK